MATESHPSLLLVPEEQTRNLPLPTRLLTQWWITFAASTIFVVCGHLLIKAGLNAAASHSAGPTLLSRLLHLVLQPQVIEGLCIYLFGTVCWMRTVAQKEISFLYPLTSLNYVMVVATSMLFFHEAISLRRAAGVVVIVTGMILMNRRSGDSI